MLKILISIFICLFMALETSASQWTEVYYKAYINIAKIDRNYVFYWEKILNNHNISQVKNKKVYYLMDYMIADCSNSGASVLAEYEYGLNGKVLSSYISPYYNYPFNAEFEPIIPQSNGEIVYKYVCGYSNYTN